ncbi:MAG: hypothetical protein DWG76_01760 [Chloroflexi bacterium]|nr:hypothetical protein [Chloroflexota bacterium]MQC26159.1 hypothetical protein [Chloroflexota bacterium]
MAISKTRETTGWLLDIYADPRDGAVVWFIEQSGARLRLTHQFPITFYAAGSSEQLRAAWKYLRRSWPAVQLGKEVQKELFDGLTDVLAIKVPNPAVQPRVFHKLHDLFPELEYYNANLSLPLLFHSLHDVYPLALCKIIVDSSHHLLHIQSLDNRWELKASAPPLRILHIRPDTNPSHAIPTQLELKHADLEQILFTSDPAGLLRQLNTIIEEYDPDLIATLYGDKWLFPHLFEISKQTGVPFNPNRDKHRVPIRVKENTFSSYGRVVHRDSQTLLLGRIHIDPRNSMAFEDTGLIGTLEQSKITGLPIQNMSRRSPGGGFTAMQVREALRNNVLVPLNKKQRERYQSAYSMVRADNGGIIFQPIIGLHRDVAEIDFFSMYPSLMARWNVSAETVGVVGEETYIVPGIDRPINQDRRGVVPAILQPVLEKRRIAKQKVRGGKLEPEEQELMESVNASLKWLGWVSYGYQGFSGNRIGSIEAHESINAISRELILRAKEAAEDMDFEVLHMYVDSLFVAQPGKHLVEEFEPLIQEMQRRTELKLDLEGVFRWLAFLPSKQDERLPVPNCYFGAFYDGRVKCRGIMARRSDTPLFVQEVQLRAIEMMARTKDFDKLPTLLPKLVSYFRHEFVRLHEGEVEKSKLVIAQNLSKNLDDYKVHSAGARAALQLKKLGKSVGAGQVVRYLRTRGEFNVLAWDLALTGQTFLPDHDWYADSLLRAAHEVLQSFGIEKEILRDWLAGHSTYYQPEDYVAAPKSGLPLLSYSPLD